MVISTLLLCVFVALLPLYNAGLIMEDPQFQAKKSPGDLYVGISPIYSFCRYFAERGQNKSRSIWGQQIGVSVLHDPF